MAKSPRRNQDRDAGARKTAAWGLLYQGLYAAAQLIVLGLIARNVSDDVYGLWLAVLALGAWVAAASVGQHAVILTVVGANASTDHRTARAAFGASLVLVSGISLSLVLLLGLSASLIPWAQILNADTPQASTMAGRVTLAALTVSLLSLPLVAGGYVVYAHQRGDLMHLLMGAGTLASLAGVALVMALQLPFWVVGAMSLAGPLFGGFMIWALHYGSALMPRPVWRDIGKPALMSAWRAGTTFLIIDLIGFGLVRTPELVVAHLHGIEAVGPFATVGRFPLLLLAAYHAVLLPYWPSLAEAAQGGDKELVRSIAMRSLGLMLVIASVSAVVMPVIGPSLIDAWIGRPGFASPDLLWAAGAQSLALGWLTWISVLLGALSHQRTLAVGLGAAMIVYFGGAAAFGSIVGPVGVAVAQAASILLVAGAVSLPTVIRVLKAKPAARF